jgi:hypothetical protein
MAGRRAEALAILEQLEELSQHRYVPASARSWAFVGLGEYDRVIEWMEKGYLLRDSGLPHIALTRAFNPLRSDPRFHDLLRRLGLVQ